MTLDGFDQKSGEGLYEPLPHLFGLLYGATVVWKLTPGMCVPSGTPLMNWTPL
jgi:hypothetical protein